MNVFCLGAIVIGAGLAMELIRTFLSARFSSAACHRCRLAKVQALAVDKIGSLSAPIQAVLRNAM
jgi:ribose 5-phosphate isomerase RpiB